MSILDIEPCHKHKHSLVTEIIAAETITKYFPHQIISNCAKTKLPLIFPKHILNTTSLTSITDRQLLVPSRSCHCKFI